MDTNKTKQPLHKSLTEEITFAGVPRGVMIVIGGLAAYCIFIFGTYHLLFINLAMYIGARWMVESDPQFFDVARCYMQTKTHYHS